MAFPDERDRNLIRQSEQVENLATDLCDWLSEFNASRRATDLLPISESDEFEMLQLRRLASSLYTSAKVPVAAAVYGPSQVGKSLFVGQVLVPHSENFCPIGGDETTANRPITRSFRSTTTSTRNAARTRPPRWSPDSRPRTGSERPFRRSFR